MPPREPHLMLADYARSRRRDEEASRAFRAPPGVSVLDRLAIYQRMYIFRLVDVLWELYPLTREALGDELFTRMAVRYVDAHPSESPAIEYVGKNLRAHLLDEGESVAAGIASLEHAALLATIAPDDRVASIGDIDAARFGEQILRPRRAVNTVTVSRASYLRWVGDAVKPSEGGDDSEVAVCISRADDFGIVHSCWYDDAWSRAFSRAVEGATVATLCEEFADHTDPVGAAYACLQNWFLHRYIAEVL